MQRSNLSIRLSALQTCLAGRQGLELFNTGSLPIKIYDKMPIAQMAFEYLSSPCERPHGTEGLNSKYCGDMTVKESDMHKNF